MSNSIKARQADLLEVDSNQLLKAEGNIEMLAKKKKREPIITKEHHQNGFFFVSPNSRYYYFLRGLAKFGEWGAERTCRDPPFFQYRFLI